uniref:hypothetical protein n=1 Tax=Dixoniella grisea TaxID=35153 RepID=UPI001FCDD8E0|nr:hypothetical protein MW560_pgp020 [Dixoniella grisea]UNJ17211.1 hypothetical protein [Dixoniella grisea]
MPLFQYTHLYNHIFFKKVYPELFEPGTGNLFQDILFLWFEQKIIIKQVSDPYNLQNLYKFYEQKSQLKKALRLGRIEISAPSFDKQYNLSTIKTQGISYTWKKGLNFPRPNHWPNLFKSSRSPNFSIKQQTTFSSQLDNFPIFVVRNGFEEISIGVTKYRESKNIFESLYNLYIDYFIWTKDKEPYSLGLFFINPQDAMEFRNTIMYKYPHSSKELQLSIYPINLNLAYTLNRTSPPHIQFRFIPDFQELSKLLKVYKYQKNIQFHKNQIYGNNYFQGQPIYIYNHIVNKSSEAQKYVSTSKEVLDKTVEHLNTQFKHNRVQNKYMITVYNLEDFLCDLEGDKQASFQIFTSSDTYQYIQDECHFKNHNILTSIKSNVNKQILFINIWAKRILWALTHVELPSI